MKYLYFTSEYCTPCKAIKPQIIKYKEIAVIDVDKNGKYVTKYNIMSIPTLLILNDDNRVENQFVGTQISRFLKENFKE